MYENIIEKINTDVSFLKYKMGNEKTFPMFLFITILIFVLTFALNKWIMKK